MIDKCVLAEQSRRYSRRFSPALLRMREAEKIIRHRYGGLLPESDGDEFFRVIAHALNALGCDDVLANLLSWCRAMAPWASQLRYRGALIDAADEVRGRQFDMCASDVAQLLCVSFEERIALRLKTIGAADVSVDELKRMMRRRKIERDRERQRAQRASDGRQPRHEYEANSFSQTRPWEVEGISRRTWERRRAASL